MLKHFYKLLFGFILLSGFNLLKATESINHSNNHLQSFNDSTIDEIVKLFNQVNRVDINKKIWHYGKNHSSLYFESYRVTRPESKSIPVAPEYEYSKNVHLLSLIYSYYSFLDSSLSYDLVDSVTQTVAYDLLFSPPLKFKLKRPYNKLKRPYNFTTEWVNADKFDKVYNSYSIWIELLQKHGLKYLQDHQISPLNDCSFQWQLNYGYLPENSIYYEKIFSTINILNEMIVDSLIIDRINYRSGALETKRYRLIELGIISIINHLDHFTENEEKFKISRIADTTGFSMALSRTEYLELIELMNIWMNEYKTGNDRFTSPELQLKKEGYVIFKTTK